MKRRLLSSLLAIMALSTGCSPSQQQQAQTQVNDAFVAAQIRAKIAAIDPATLSNVHVKVANHTAIISGQVPSQQEHDKIVAAARSVAGINKLDDGLKVNPKAPTAKELQDDLTLQARIKAALAEQTGINAFRVEVSVHKGSVVLAGSVASKSVHSLVLETVRGVHGVRQIVDHLTIGQSH